VKTRKKKARTREIQRKGYPPKAPPKPPARPKPTNPVADLSRAPIIGQQIDTLRMLQVRRRTMQIEVDRLKQREAVLEDQITTDLTKLKLDTGIGKLATATIVDGSLELVAK